MKLGFCFAKPSAQFCNPNVVCHWATEGKCVTYCRNRFSSHICINNYNSFLFDSFKSTGTSQSKYLSSFESVLLPILCFNPDTLPNASHLWILMKPVGSLQVLTYSNVWLRLGCATTDRTQNVPLLYCDSINLTGNLRFLICFMEISVLRDRKRRLKRETRKDRDNIS